MQINKKIKIIIFLITFIIIISKISVADTILYPSISYDGESYKRKFNKNNGVGFLQRPLNIKYSKIKELSNLSSIENFSEYTIQKNSKNYYLIRADFKDIFSYHYIANVEFDIIENNVCIGYSLLNPILIEKPNEDNTFSKIKNLNKNSSYLKNEVKISPRYKNNINLYTYEKEFSGFIERYIILQYNYTNKYSTLDETFLLAEMFYPKELEDEISKPSKELINNMVERFTDAFDFYSEITTVDDYMKKVQPKVVKEIEDYKKKKKEEKNDK